MGPAWSEASPGSPLKSGTLTSGDLFRARLSIGAPDKALGWKRPGQYEGPKMEVLEGYYEENMKHGQ